MTGDSRDTGRLNLLFGREAVKMTKAVRRKSKESVAVVEKVKKMLAEGAGYTDIRTELHVGTSRISDIRKEMGIRAYMRMGKPHERRAKDKEEVVDDTVPVRTTETTVDTAPKMVEATVSTDWGKISKDPEKMIAAFGELAEQAMRPQTLAMFKPPAYSVDLTLRSGREIVRFTAVDIDEYVKRVEELLEADHAIAKRFPVEQHTLVVPVSVPQQGKTGRSAITRAIE